MNSKFHHQLDCLTVDSPSKEESWEGHRTLIWVSRHSFQPTVCNSALTVHSTGKGLEYRVWEGLGDGAPPTEPWQSHHPGWWRPSSVAALGSPTHLLVATHPCSVSKPNKLTGFSGWTYVKSNLGLSLKPYETGDRHCVVILSQGENYDKTNLIL